MNTDTPTWIALARRVRRTFGIWEEARKAAVQGNDGVYRIRTSICTAPRDPPPTPRTNRCSIGWLHAWK